METLISIVGFLLLWAATDVGRNKESKIKIGTKKWFAVFTLITIGGLILSNVTTINNSL